MKYLFCQVRPLVINNKYCLDEEINRNIAQANLEIKNLFKKKIKFIA